MKQARTTRKENRKERGSVLAMSTLGMLAFLLATGLCVDVGHLYLVKSELQNAADAAALAGASGLNSNESGIVIATARATAAMNSYEFNRKPTALDSTNISFAVNLGGPYINATAAANIAKKIRFVKVTIPPKAVGVTFATMVLGTSRSLTAEATAGMSVPLNRICDYIPLTVIDDNVRLIEPGRVYTIRRQSGSFITPGNYQILAIDGPGGSDDRLGLAGGVKKCVGAGEYVKTKPGVTSGDVRQGINARFGEYASGLDPAQFPPDVNVAENIPDSTYELSKLKGNEGMIQPPPRGTGIWDRRLVIIPIIKKSQFDNGRDSVQIDRFGLFFLRSKVSGGNGGEIVAEYLDTATVVGRGTFDPTGGTASPEMTIPVLYK